MKGQFPHFSSLLLAAGALLALPGIGRADDVPPENQIHLTYHGGALLKHVKVSQLFWGQGWKGSPTRDSLSGFFQALFDDGRYMANLSQYSQGGFQIGNGSVVTTADDPVPLSGVLDDEKIPEEISRQIQAGSLPAPDADTLYVVFTPPGVTPKSIADEPKDEFIFAYHFVGQDQDGNPFPYLIVPTPDQRTMAAVLQIWGIHRADAVMTQAASHEMAEAVTDPQPDLQQTSQGGWYDPQVGEIGDVPGLLFTSGQISITDLFDVLTAADGTRYLVQKEWSEQDGKPVAFAAPAPTVGLQ